jgi:hypothetical protein
MTTDGTVLLTAAADSSGSVNGVRAYSLDDGRLLWQEDLRTSLPWHGVVGNLTGVALRLPVGRIGAMRADGSLTVLG